MHQRQLFCTQREWLIRPCIFLSEISSFIREWNLDSSLTYRETLRIKNTRKKMLDSSSECRVNTYKSNNVLRGTLMYGDN